jgi:hypothetical protein
MSDFAVKPAYTCYPVAHISGVRFSYQRVKNDCVATLKAHTIASRKCV